MTDATTTADPTTGEIPTESEAEIDEAAIRSFATLLVEHRYGQCAVDASTKLNELIAGITELGKGGTITIQFKIRPAGKGKTDKRMLQVTDKITVDIPQPEAESAIFYATDSNGLSREDPRQQRLPIHEVPKPQVRNAPEPAPVREVGN